MRRTDTRECSTELDLDKFYRVVTKDEILLATDLAREYSPLEFPIIDRDKQGWYRADELIPGWVGHSQQEYFDFVYNRIDIDTPKNVTMTKRRWPFAYQLEVLREVTHKEMMAKVRKKRKK